MRHSLLVLALVVATACGGGGSGGGAPAGTDVDAAGGTVTSTSGPTAGASVVVPPNALTSTVRIAIDSGSEVSTAAGTTKVGPPVRFSPGGTNFAIDARVTVPFTASSVPAGRQVMVAQLHSGGTITVHDTPTVDLAMGHAAVDVDSFSTFQAFIAPVPATFDATGNWVVNLTNNFSTPPGDEDADANALVTITQTGNDVTVEADGVTYTGTVSGADYAVAATYDEDGGTTNESIDFSLTDPDTGLGTLAWSWTDSSGTTTGGGDITLMRQMAPLFVATGTWNVNFVGNFSMPAGHEDDDRLAAAEIVQNGSDFTVEIDGMTHNGFISGDRYYFDFVEVEPDGETEVQVQFTLDTPMFGAGTVRWRFYGDSGEIIDGGSDLSMDK